MGFFKKWFSLKSKIFPPNMIFLRSDLNPEWSQEHFPILKLKIESKNTKLFFRHFLSNPLMLQPAKWVLESRNSF